MRGRDAVFDSAHHPRLSPRLYSRHTHVTCLRMSGRGGSDISPDPAPEAAAALDAFRSQLLLRGMDLVHSMSTGSYNRALAEMASAEGPESAIASLHPLPSYGRPVRSDSDSDSGCLALILGNSRSLWRPFLRWLRADGARLDGLPNPLDSYVTEATELALAPLDRLGVRREIYWAWEVAPDRLVALGRAAHLSGMAYLDGGASRLAIHPDLGTWFSLRALVVLDLPPEPEPGVRFRGWDPVELLPEEERRLAGEAFDRALAASSADLGELRGGTDDRGGGDDGGSKGEVWREWVALRDVVRRGREEHRFGEDQIEYHYTKNRAALRRSVRDLEGEPPAEIYDEH